MQLDPEVRSRLEDIQTYAADAIRYVEPVTLDDFKVDDMRHRAVVRCLEVIGEAAAALRRRFDKEEQNLVELFPHVPWPMMISMRNILMHEYGRVNLDMVYQTVSEDLPVLLEHVHNIFDKKIFRTGDKRSP